MISDNLLKVINNKHKKVLPNVNNRIIRIKEK